MRKLLSAVLYTAIAFGANAAFAGTAELEALPETNPPTRATAANLAYVIFTSGSTGRPKGTNVSHRAIVRLVRQTDYVSFSPDEVFLQMAPIAFDASIDSGNAYRYSYDSGTEGLTLTNLTSGASETVTLTSTLDAMKLMRRHGVTTLLVVDDDRLVGIVSVGDFMPIAERALREAL